MPNGPVPEGPAPGSRLPEGHLDALHPAHDTAPLRRAPTEIVAQWAPGCFLENLTQDDRDLSWLVTSPTDRAVYRIAPDGAVTTAAHFDRTPTGIATHPSHGILTAVGTQGQPDWRLARITAEGTEDVCALPKVLSANGMAFIDDRLLVVDSGRAEILTVDPTTGAVEAWLRHPLLEALTPGAPLPGVNGIDVWDGTVFLSSSDRGLILRVPATSPRPSTDVEVVAERLVADDLVVAPDGRLFVATHTFHSVLCLHPDGRREIVADHADGIAGPTAVAIGTGPSPALFVTTTGGLLSPPAGDVEPARLVRVDALCP